MYFSGYISEYSQGNGGDGNVYSACFWGCPQSSTMEIYFFNGSTRQRSLESKGFHTVRFIRDILGHNENK